MFCGWRLHTSKPLLAELGSGSLTIDVLTGQCSFEGRSIPQLRIAEELRLWLRRDLEANQIPVESIDRATLVAKLLLSEIAWDDGTTHEIWFKDGQPMHTDTMHRCAIACEAQVVTDEAVYRSELDDVEEWPPGWPSTSSRS